MTDILDIIKQKHIISGGHNGTRFNEIKYKTGLEKQALAKELNRLYKEKKIIIREGINEKLIFYNDRIIKTM